MLETSHVIIRFLSSIFITYGFTHASFGVHGYVPEGRGVVPPSFDDVKGPYQTTRITMSTIPMATPETAPITILELLSEVFLSSSGLSPLGVELFEISTVRKLHRKKMQSFNWFHSIILKIHTIWQYVKMLYKTFDVIDHLI